MEFLFSHNQEKALYMGDQFQQDLDVAGMYMVGPVSEDTQRHYTENFPGQFLMSVVRFKNPLAISFNSRGGGISS